MLTEKRLLFITLFALLLFGSCNKKVVTENPAPISADETQTTAQVTEAHHPYGGWYCPDNFRFPPVDIQNLQGVEVVTDRLPTKEETRNGTSLMYFDSTEFPDAKPLDIALPTVASIHSKQKGMNEIIIVIQAVVVNGDTVVGFRYPNGGNGTSWFREVRFLSQNEIKGLGPSPFVYIHEKIKATKAEIWNAICKTSYAKELGEKFNQKAFFESAWTAESKAYLNYKYDSASAMGIISSAWGNLYMQVDYNKKGFHFSEKMMVTELTDENTAELHFVSGPYPKHIKTKQLKWEKWIQEIKASSE